MYITDIFTLLFCLIIITAYGFLKSRAHGNETAEATMHGSGASVLSVALSVCSGFISSISLLGFPAEVYFHGGMMLWFAPMYAISFPIVAYVFLPALYKLKLTTIYEYFEKRFNYECRFITTSLFCLQMILYNSVALYAPSLAIASITKIPIICSILITAFLSAIYISLGGAKAGIHTSALQMTLIFMTMSFIIVASLRDTSIADVVRNNIRGKRLHLSDFRINPTIRHSVWSLLIGGTGNILSLFAANQLSIQRYMAMPNLKSAQRVVLLNILCNSLILFSYIGIGMIIYSHYNECHPKISNSNELLPQFVMDVLSNYPGAVGLFAAAVYSAGISTLSASFTAVSSIVINDVWKVYRLKNNYEELNLEDVKMAMKYTPIALAVISIGIAIVCSNLQSIILQLSFIVFGAGGGPVLGSFTVGLFLPSVKGKSALFGLIMSIIVCFTITIGSAVLKVKPIPLELGSCSQFNTTIDESQIGFVTSIPLYLGLDRIFAISYQYYSILGLLINVVASIFAQFIVEKLKLDSESKTPVELLSPMIDQQYTNEPMEMKA